MPVIVIRAMEPADAIAVDRLLAALPPALAAVGYAPRDVWATFSAVAPGRMALGGETVAQGHAPVALVEVKARGRKRVGEKLAVVARCVAEHLGPPLADVWCHYTALEPGEVFAGGRLL